jgi:hypothetical protein
VTGVADSLEALLADLVDYAGLYPPAALPLDEVCERYAGYLKSPEKWILNRLVLPAPLLGKAALPPAARVTLLVEEEPGALPANVETLETKGTRGLSLPTYCEAPMEQIEGAFAKVRTGGLTAATIVPASELAEFLCRAAALRLPFKATAGLHHALRSERALTYEPASERATMHGFLNLFAAAAFAWHGHDREAVLGMLVEREARAFDFREDALVLHGHRLTTEKIRAARRYFAHSFGSCSFEEPVSELRDLGLIP